MLRIHFVVLVMLTAGAATARAQQPAAPAAPAHNTFMLAGCLEAPLPGNSAFRLTDAMPVGQAPPGGPTPADTASGSPKAKPAYYLQPVSSLNQSGVNADAFKPHLGKRVEVTIRPLDTVAPAPPTGSTTATAPPPAAPQPYSVIAIKPTGGACS